MHVIHKLASLPQFPVTFYENFSNLMKTTSQLDVFPSAELEQILYIGFLGINKQTHSLEKT